MFWYFHIWHVAKFGYMFFWMISLLACHRKRKNKLAKTNTEQMHSSKLVSLLLGTNGFFVHNLLPLKSFLLADHKSIVNECS